jgi:Tol biopolymer transport system component
VTGARAIVDSVGTRSTGEARYDFARSGALAYVASQGDDGVRLAWAGSNGVIEELPYDPANFRELDLSPDGRRIAIDLEDDAGESQIWIFETMRGGGAVLFAAEGSNEFPVWSPDGEWILFASNRGTGFDIWRRRADLSGEVELVLDLEADIVPASISRDGTLLFTNRDIPSDLGTLVLDSDEEPVILETPITESSPEFSPDGRFYVFSSNDPGGTVVYAREVASGRTFPVSTTVRGGGFGHWSHDGTRVFHVAKRGGAGIMVADVSLDDFTASEPVQAVAVERGFLTNYAVAPEGDRFLVLTPGQNRPRPRISVVLNWFDELERRLPTER